MARLGMAVRPLVPLWLGLVVWFVCCGDSSAAPVPPAPAAEAPAQSAGAAAAASAAPSVIHVVKEGETLWDIARAYGVTVDAILQASGKTQRDVRRLSKGAQLRIPGARQAIDVLAAKQRAAELPKLTDGAYHRLQRGESLWTVARTYEVPIETLMERNKLSDDDLPNLRI